MSKLSEQCDELRKMAAAMSERGSAIGLDYGMGRGLVDAARMIREAADTIERLQGLQGVASESRYTELFGTPEKAARTLLDACDNCGQDECSGCQVYELTSGGDLDYDALLEWLRGDAE